MKIVQPKLSSGDILIDRYRIDGEIGQGGMQQVFSATDLSLKREVALKVPISPSGQKRFERSARLSANIVHPNVAKTLDYGTSEHGEFLVEELIWGKNLQERLDSDLTVIDPHLAAHIIHHIARAVAAMNARDIIHRDLKPSNIMVSDDFALLTVKVTDFGVARMAAAEIEGAVAGGHESIVASKTVVGALAFMAPEVITKGANRTKCDVWSIGALLFYLLFREYPFGNELAAISNILGGKFPDKTAAVAGTKSQFKDLSASLWQIITRCLVKAVDERPTAAELVEMFSEVSYSVAPREAGTIGYINPGSGSWGFINPDDGSDDVFFHYGSFYGGRPSSGLRVVFSDYPGVPQARAHPVVPVNLP
jgi:eukaryotic-like serine/threonine-protein kinase